MQQQTLVSQCPQRVPGDEGSLSDNPGCQLYFAKQGRHTPTASFPMGTQPVGLSSSVVGCACWGAPRAVRGLVSPSVLHLQPLCTGDCGTASLGPRLQHLLRQRRAGRSQAAINLSALLSSLCYAAVPGDWKSLRTSCPISWDTTCRQLKPSHLLAGFPAENWNFVKMKVSLQSTSNM